VQASAEDAQIRDREQLTDLLSQFGHDIRYGTEGEERSRVTERPARFYRVVTWRMGVFKGFFRREPWFRSVSHLEKNSLNAADHNVVPPRIDRLGLTSHAAHGSAASLTHLYDRLKFER